MTNNQVTTNQVTKPTINLNTQQVVGGAILIGLGGVLAIAGMALAGAAIVSAYRDRVSQMDVPPTELARRHWGRIKAATAAGVGQWQNGAQDVQSQPVAVTVTSR
jgi:hypothetical protein